MSPCGEGIFPSPTSPFQLPSFLPFFPRVIIPLPRSLPSHLRKCKKWRSFLVGHQKGMLMAASRLMASAKTGFQHTYNPLTVVHLCRLLFKVAFKSCIYLRCIKCHISLIMLDVSKINTNSAPANEIMRPVYYPKLNVQGPE